MACCLRHSISCVTCHCCCYDCCAFFSMSATLSYFLNSTRLLKKEVASFEPKEAELKEKLKERFNGLELTKEAIVKLTEEQGIKLDLGNKGVGNSCAIIIGRWICGDSAKFCQELKLSNNQITNEGAIYLAKSLEMAPNISTVDLRKNSIEEEGVIALGEALSKNIVITTFNCDINPPAVSKEITDKIERELRINRFLQNKL